MQQCMNGNLFYQITNSSHVISNGTWMTGPQMVRRLKGMCVVGAFDQYAVVIGGKDSNGMLWHYFFSSFAVKGLAFCQENNLALCQNF